MYNTMRIEAHREIGWYIIIKCEKQRWVAATTQADGQRSLNRGDLLLGIADSAKMTALVEMMSTSFDLA